MEESRGRGQKDGIDQVKSEIRQGEWDSVKNYPAVFVRRIQSRLGLTV